MQSQVEDEGATSVEYLNSLLPSDSTRVVPDMFSKRWVGSWGDQTVSRSWKLHGQTRSGLLVVKAIWEWYTDATGIECEHSDVTDAG